MGKTQDAMIHVLDVIRSGRSANIVGPPGCNKSGSLAQGGEVFLARAADHGIDPKDMGHRDFRPAMEDPTEIKGMPFPDIQAGTTTWLHPDWLPDGGHGILVIEEIGNASKAHHAALYQLTAERRIRDKKLPDGWDVVATSNRREDGCGVNRLPGALENRFNRVPWEPSVEDYTKWARDNGVNREVIAAVNFHKDMIEKYDGSMEGPQSTGRSITSFAKIHSQTGCSVAGSYRGGSHHDMNGEDRRVYRYAEGDIGSEDAARMVAFLGIFSRLPNIKGILSGADVQAPSEYEADIALATVTKLVEKGDRSNVKNILAWVDKLPPVCRAVFANDAVESSIGKTDSFLQWMRTNSSLMY
tara:strand:- start:2277 stop:3347 length:1071 start_codon:yes stop_codon:yes gene_type:complete